MMEQRKNNGENKKAFPNRATNGESDGGGTRGEKNERKTNDQKPRTREFQNFRERERGGQRPPDRRSISQSNVDYPTFKKERKRERERVKWRRKPRRETMQTEDTTVVSVCVRVCECVSVCECEKYVVRRSKDRSWIRLHFFSCFLFGPLSRPPGCHCLSFFYVVAEV